MDAADLTATEARARIAAGRLTPTALAEACLARAAAREPTLRAMAHLDPAATLREAAAAPEGVLHGLPIGVKDVLDTADMPSQYGSPIWAGWQPRADAAAVAWARAAGAVVFGKTVTTEFATRAPGPTANPHNPAHTPGGSSSGSAAGVAAGYFPLAFGTQTAGSIVRPAAYCGVVGYKPSFGLISRVGMKVMASSLDTVGVLARSVADCALLAAALTGRSFPSLDRVAERAPRIALCQGPAWPSAAPETMALFEDAATRLARAGATVTPLALPPLFARALALHPTLMHAESARAMGWELTHHRAQLTPGLQQALEAGLAATPAALDEAHAVFAEARQALPGVMEGHDIILTPSAPGEAPKGLDWTGDPVFNALWTGLHGPCITVPAGEGPNGLPLGLQAITPAGQDEAALHWANWLAHALAG